MYIVNAIGEIQAIQRCTIGTFKRRNIPMKPIQRIISHRIVYIPMKFNRTLTILALTLFVFVLWFRMRIYKESMMQCPKGQQVTASCPSGAKQTIDSQGFIQCSKSKWPYFSTSAVESCTTGKVFMTKNSIYHGGVGV